MRHPYAHRTDEHTGPAAHLQVPGGHSVGRSRLRPVRERQLAGQSLALDVAGARVVGDLARDVPLMPGSKPVLPALSELRRRGHELAVVLDEYGGTDGIVTTRDLVDALIGDLRDERESISEAARDLRGAGLEVDGRVHLDDLRVDKGVDLPDGPYETVAGFVLAQLGRVPSVGDAVAVAGHRFEVTAMDGLRVSRLRITAEPPQEAHP